LPTIEFYGYDSRERRDVEAGIRERLAAEDFREQCVFVDGPATAVRDWHGASLPFVRVSTRSPERAARFQILLKDLCDLETVHIGFQPRTSEESQ
jgi:hypothetical protein